MLVITTPEPTSIADAYALIKSVSGRDISRLEILVNQCDSAPQANLVAQRIQETARTFLHVDVTAGGFVPKDPSVAAAVSAASPSSSTARNLPPPPL